MLIANAEQLDPAEVTVTSLHPGTQMPTKMTNYLQGGDTLEDGIENVVRLAVSPDLEGVTGVFSGRQFYT